MGIKRSHARVTQKVENFLQGAAWQRDASQEECSNPSNIGLVANLPA